MANRKKFITAKQINKIISHYGGMRRYTRAEYDNAYNRIYFHEKNNKYMWLTINNIGTYIEVRLTDETGVITKREGWVVNNHIPMLWMEGQYEKYGKQY